MAVISKRMLHTPNNLWWREIANIQLYIESSTVDHSIHIQREFPPKKEAQDEQTAEDIGNLKFENVVSICLT